MERLVGLSSLLYTTTFRFNKWNLLLCAFRDYNWIERLLCACVVQNVTLSTYFFSTQPFTLCSTNCLLILSISSPYKTRSTILLHRDGLSK